MNAIRPIIDFCKVTLILALCQCEMAGAAEDDNGPSNRKTLWDSIEPIRLRQTHSDLVKQFDDADSAKLGYNRDFRDRSSTWSIKASLGLPLTLKTNEEIPDFIRMRRLDLLPSVSIDKLSGAAKDDQTDSLVFR